MNKYYTIAITMDMGKFELRCISNVIPTAKLAYQHLHRVRNLCQEAKIELIEHDAKTGLADVIETL